MKIVKKQVTVYSEIRDFEGHSTRSTGRYDSDVVDVYMVGRQEFRTRQAAQRYINSLVNKKDVKKLKDMRSMLIKQQETLEKKLNSLDREVVRVSKTLRDKYGIY